MGSGVGVRFGFGEFWFGVFCVWLVVRLLLWVCLMFVDLV